MDDRNDIRQFPKSCTGCPLVYTYEQWLKLELVGPMDDGDGGTLELRNCSCTSTISVRAS